jgi:hypothetical protein
MKQFQHSPDHDAEGHRDLNKRDSMLQDDYKFQRYRTFLFSQSFMSLNPKFEYRAEHSAGINPKQIFKHG